MNTKSLFLSRSTLLLALLMLPAGILFAQTAANSNAAGFRDHPLINPFPDSEIIDMSFDEDVNYRMVLGSLQRTRGEVIPENSQRVRGDLTKINYEISQQFTGDDVFEFYKEMMSGEKFTELFTCSGRGCGSSNYWANDIFKNRILYGPERNQHYVAFSISTDREIDPMASLYIITRGNRRVYAYFEIIEEGGAAEPPNLINPQEMLSDLNDQGSIIIPNIEFDGSDRVASSSNLAMLMAILESDPEMKVYLVAHLQGEQGLESLVARSLARASSLRRALITAGIDPARISAQGVGPLVPACSQNDCAERIELVLQ
ncbi:MAG: DUF4892 domain-containing protein [Gammaproteobacteria bacterium]|jgi:hypothetical protein|nr:DUF4892 domain-containing protein [Gammaproteobacteria bacterium]MBT3858729.1 DUF4892 domain-containing protein [Gammaproteobacteria bacterium]MBT3986081.1 DUF4892 domain-containing protein [Gammaproteobacteria bacterium]MBT4255457.1 DUF4892 domain-containing protein [Gammaproteobacteria bacterium]MBT4580792.1 DUF4892 domain-containing protein [Gammaproteobacteria bacterium]